MSSTSARSRKPFTASARLGAKLSTSREALNARARAAIIAAGLPVNTFTASAGNRDSETQVLLENGTLLLVSYETVVAYRPAGWTFVPCVWLGQCSRTTDRSIREFASGRSLVEKPVADFLEGLADASV